MWGDAMTRRIFIIIVVEKIAIFGLCAQFQWGGHTSQKFGDVRKNKWYLLCSNVAIIRRSISRVIEYPPARIGELVMNQIGVEGGAKS